jgi:hypothetical protein
VEMYSPDENLESVFRYLTVRGTPTLEAAP